jgi:transcriptional pleiotropic regulator of transition state genes
MMKNTGVVRRLDDLGRITLPIEIRRTMNLDEHDKVEIFVENDQIILRKYEPACIFCGCDRRLVCHAGKNVCRDCVRKMNEL